MRPLTRDETYVEKKLTPVILAGVVAPWSEEITNGETSDYKLVCLNGIEYVIVADPDWRDIFARYCWKEVKVIGLLNLGDMTLIPQKVYPRGPTGEKEYVIDPAVWMPTRIVNKALKSMSEFVLGPPRIKEVAA